MHNIYTPSAVCITPAGFPVNGWPLAAVCCGQFSTVNEDRMRVSPAMW